MCFDPGGRLLSAPMCRQSLSMYCDSALPLAEGASQLSALRVLIDVPAAHMQANIENAAHEDLMLIDLGKTERS